MRFNSDVRSSRIDLNVYLEWDYFELFRAKSYPPIFDWEFRVRLNFHTFPPTQKLGKMLEECHSVSNPVRRVSIFSNTIHI